MSAFPRFLGLGAWLSALVLLAACSNELTELVVVVDSDLPVPAGLDEVVVTVEGASPARFDAQTRLVGAGAPRLPVTLGVRPREPGSGPVTLRAVGRLGDVERVVAEVRTRFVEGERRIVRIRLDARCVEVRCDDGATCSEGMCVDATVDPSTLPRFDGTLDLGAVDAGDSDAGAPDLGVDAGDLDLGVDAGDLDLGMDAGEPCPAGYRREGAACVDVDECAATGNPCGAGTCFDNEGSYACMCPPTGYRLVATPGITCADIDECLEGTADCDGAPAATCGNTQGSFLCMCPSGYAGIGRGTDGCADIDECATNTDDCDDAPDACTNTVGGFACACAAPFTGDGVGASGCLCNDPALISLGLSPGVGLVPAFASDVTDYRLTLPPGARTTTLTPSTACGDRAVVTIDGETLTPGASMTVASGAGFTRGAATIDVVTESGATRRYTSSIERGSWYVKASNTDSQDFFGAAIALSADGSTLAGGARGESSNARGVGGDPSNNAAGFAGAVYVFRRDATGRWAQEAYLKASNTDAGDGFGAAVALSANGSYLVVGAPGEDSSAVGVDGDGASNAASDSGAAYVFFRLSAGTWVQESYLKASNTGVQDNFGAAVVITSQWIAVGAPLEDSAARGLVGADQTSNTAMNSGAVYLFYNNPEVGWTQELYVKPSVTDPMGQFGKTLALSTDESTLAVGAITANLVFPRAGAAYVFRRTGFGVGTWAEEAQLRPVVSGPDETFGGALALSSNGSVLAVGAPNESSSATGIGGDPLATGAASPGAADVFTRSTAPVRWT